MANNERLSEVTISSYLQEMQETKDALQSAIDDLKHAVKDIDDLNSIGALVCIRRASARLFGASETLAL